MAPIQPLLSIVLSCFALLVRPSPQREKHFYPTSVPSYEIRKDSYTNETVTRGKLHLINYVVNPRASPMSDEEQRKTMVSFADFQKHLQCASPEAELDGTRGGWSMIQMVPPTKHIVEQVCAWTESKCHPWADCQEKVKSFKSGSYEKRNAPALLDFVWLGRTVSLLRVINNEFHYDWPWGIERFVADKEHYKLLLHDHYALFEMVLRLVSDIGDSVFFFGGERPFLQWNVPFPTFSFAPSLSYADFPFPWHESYVHEFNLYARAEKNNNFNDSYYHEHYTPWEKRVEKAAFFASFQSFRQMVYDSAALRPDLFDVSFADSAMEPWNPASDEPMYNPHARHPTMQPAVHPATADAPAQAINESKYHPGFLKPIRQFSDNRHYSPHLYKYVIVPVGSGDLSSSGRLAGLLAHSGAVVLLQKSEFAYHFSARLEPWVHYVPLSHSMADVIDKVEWLKRNDHLARRIVRNAENFAQSYLRAEDYLCYAAGSLRLLHDLEKTTDVLQGFSPVKIE